MKPERYVDRELRRLRETGRLHRLPPVRDRRDFWSKVQCGKDNECWPWTGFKTKSGHGLTSYKSVSMYASRKAYILTNGPLDSTLCVNHKCDNPICCNPAHMYLGSRADNMVDRFGNTPAEERTHGRKRVLNDQQIETLWQMRRDGKLLRECADHFKVHVGTIHRYVTARRKLVLETLQLLRQPVPINKIDP